MPGKKITKEERQIALSMLLGNNTKGRIERDGRLRIQHRKDDVETLRWKKNLLSKFLMVTKVEECNSDCYFYTGSKNFLRLYRHVIYGQGSKKRNIYTRKFLNRFDKLGLAIWFTTSFVFLHRKALTQASRLVSGSFLRTEAETVTEYFLEVWGIETQIQRQQGNFRLCFNPVETKKFVRLIYPFLETIVPVKKEFDKVLSIDIDTHLMKVRSRERIQPSKEQRILVVEMLIGDGTLDKDGRFSIKHSDKQLGYLEWKRNLLSDFLYVSEVKHRKEKIKYKGEVREYSLCVFRTGREKFLMKYRKALYPNEEKKMYTKRMLSRLTERGLSIWYMDDGNIYNSEKSKYSVISLSTYCTKNDAQIIVQYFQEVWNIRFRSALHKSKYIVSTCGYKETVKFLDIVRPYIEEIPCMCYKLKCN